MAVYWKYSCRKTKQMTKNIVLMCVQFSQCCFFSSGGFYVLFFLNNQNGALNIEKRLPCFFMLLCFCCTVRFCCVFLYLYLF